MEFDIQETIWQYKDILKRRSFEQSPKESPKLQKRWPIQRTKEAITGEREMSNPWTDGSLINEKALDDPKVLEVVADLLKGTIYEVEEE